MKRRPAKSSEKVVRIKRGIATVGEPPGCQTLTSETLTLDAGIGEPILGGRNDKKSSGWFLYQLTTDGMERVPVLWTQSAPRLFHRIMQRVFFGYKWQKL